MSHYYKIRGVISKHTQIILSINMSSLCLCMDITNIQYIGHIGNICNMMESWLQTHTMESHRNENEFY